MRVNFAWYINTVVSLKGAANNSYLRWTPISCAPFNTSQYSSYFKNIGTFNYLCKRGDGVSADIAVTRHSGIGTYELLRAGMGRATYDKIYLLHDTYDNDGNHILVKFYTLSPYDIDNDTSVYPEHIKNEILDRSEDFKLFMDDIILNSFDMYDPRESTFISYSETNPRTFYIKQAYSCDFINQGNVVNYVSSYIIIIHFTTTIIYNHIYLYAY